VHLLPAIHVQEINRSNTAANGKAGDSKREISVHTAGVQAHVTNHSNTAGIGMNQVMAEEAGVHPAVIQRMCPEVHGIRNRVAPRDPARQNRAVQEAAQEGAVKVNQAAAAEQQKAVPATAVRQPGHPAVHVAVHPANGVLPNPADQNRNHPDLQTVQVKVSNKKSVNRIIKTKMKKSSNNRTGNYAAANGEENFQSSEKTGNEKTLQHVFEEQLKDIYGAEKQILKALPKMIEAASSEELQEAFENHLEQTEEQVTRLEKVFSMLGINRQAKNCVAMEGLIEEGNEIIDEFEEGNVRDCALIIGAQKIEHYEIAAYGSLCELAEVMGLHKVADLLDTTLEEEEETDKLLTEIAENVNDEAMEESEQFM
jgi:ferritin-like metal-binding protein YciE